MTAVVILYRSSRSVLYVRNDSTCKGVNRFFCIEVVDRRTLVLYVQVLHRQIFILAYGTENSEIQIISISFPSSVYRTSHYFFNFIGIKLYLR